ncbi:metal cation symporter ZIP14-like [Argopecten irradians]|uniref:metal cation symporter ZIP14-like n=1 Tax=Argopecten irradians TaxID=31199 RepID=UPI0037123EDF
MMRILASLAFVTVLIAFTNAQLGNKYVEALLDLYGTNGVVSQEGFYELSSKLGLNSSYTSDGSTCNVSTDSTCARRCMGYEDIFKTFSTSSSLNTTSLSHSLPAIVFSVQDDHCHHAAEKEETEHEAEKPSSTEAWGYGIASASVIVFISNIGVFFKPCMKSRGFQRIMYFCVALASGTLGGTGLLVLIPESLEITGEDSPIPQYKQKLIMAIAGIYIFFLIEQFINWRASHMKRRKELEVDVESSDTKKLKNETPVAKNAAHGHSHGGEGGVATVAWTLLLGDALHNISDGLAMGAAYTENVALGISVSLAILSEELPHELGDIAILLHSGMTIKRALFYNFLAAVTIYLGLVIGIVIGENTTANTYIFAFAGGLFVYIALADMVPEIGNQAVIAETLGQDSPRVVFFLQNFGLVVGFGIVILVATLGGNIAI